MPRKKTEPDPEQMDLIDVDDPAFKEVKKEIMGYEKLKEENREQHSADRVAEQEKRKKVLAAVEKANIKPDAEGAYHLKFGGKEWIIRQDSQLKIKKHAIKDDTVEEPEEAPEQVEA